MNARATIAMAGIGAALLLAGCGGRSVWEQTFVGAPEGMATALTQDAPVRVRSIPWDRMQRTLSDLEQDAIASDVHPDDASPQKKSETRLKLLRGLQYGGDPSRTQILGRCEFRTTETLRPDTDDKGALEAFARKVGATDVVWSSRILGRTEKIVDRAVTSTSTGNFWGSHRDHDRWWDDNYTQTSTTWVPIRVPADDTGFIAYFLRTN